VKDDPRERHLSNAMIRAIVERGGVVGINLYDRFLLPSDHFNKRRATLDDVIAHLKHVCDLAGNALHVAIGTDMDGGLGREQIPVEIKTSKNLDLFSHKLLSSGFDEPSVQLILSGNWIRTMARKSP